MKGGGADAIRLTNRMINALPQHQRQPTDTDGHLIDLALQSDTAALADPAGNRLARDYHESCKVKVDVTHSRRQHALLPAGHHDRLVANTNVDFCARSTATRHRRQGEVTAAMRFISAALALLIGIRRRRTCGARRAADPRLMASNAPVPLTPRAGLHRDRRHFLPAA